MAITAYWLKDPITFSDRIPRKMMSVEHMEAVVEQAPFLWFGLKMRENGPTEWRGTPMHNVWFIEGEPDKKPITNQARKEKTNEL